MKSETSEPPAIILSNLQEVWKEAASALGGVESNFGGPVHMLLTLEDVACTTKHDFLAQLLEARDVLEPLNKSCQEKVKTLDLMQARGQIRLGTLLGLSRRLGPHTKPPPQYNDPTGSDAFCVPGYVFPCPDVQMMLRSTLFLGGAPQAMLRSLPPDIGAELQPGFTSVYTLKLASGTKEAQCFYSINMDMLRPYNPAQAPVLSAPGVYTVQAYSQAPGFLPSEMAIKSLTLVVHVVVEETVTTSAVPTSSTQQAPSVSVVGSAPSSAFGGLFLGDDDDDDDDGESDDA